MAVQSKRAWLYRAHRRAVQAGAEAEAVRGGVLSA